MQFQPVAGVNREVKNIFDGFSSTIDSNNDLNGHGTHVVIIIIK